ncbi:MAG: endonuclease/exonuclease/phosphatase family protein [Clostridia bacterium]|nr:endonuclease/exonuclease/phosphatase family protein [Clostridia bacterium]
MTNKTKHLPLLLSALLLLTSALPLTVTAEDPAPALILTEICFNPTFQENDKDLADTADVLEYVEVVNASDKPVSLEGATLQYSEKGFDGPFKSNAILGIDGTDMTLAAGEIAVIAIYNADTAKAGLAYATAEEKKAYYDFFVEFYNCADRLPEKNFYVAPYVESGTDTKIDGAFRLWNENPDSVMRITDKKGSTLCEATYDAAKWNRNWFSVNFIYRPNVVEGHPLASKDYNVGGCTPALIRDNQITAEGLAPTGDTIPLKVMEYNVCAENTKQTLPDGTQPTMDQRISFVFDYIRSENPDVVGLTEINHLWVPRLEAEMTQEGGQYAAYGRAGQGSTYGSGKYSGQKWDLFNLILWNAEKYVLVDSGSFWGSKNPNRPNSCGWGNGINGDMGRAMNWVILKDKASGVEFFFMCAHLDAKVEEVRTLSAELIVNKATELSGGRPVIMVGDWNANERKPAYELLAYGPYADARYRTADLSDMTVFNTYNKWGEYTDQHTTRPPIDHCFISPATVFVDSALMDPVYMDEGKTMYGSDHNATVFSLQLLIPAVEPDTEAPTEESTEAPTDPATETNTPPVTDTPTEAPTDTPEEPAKTGCQSSAIASVAVITACAAVALAKKREE